MDGSGLFFTKDVEELRRWVDCYTLYIYYILLLGMFIFIGDAVALLQNGTVQNKRRSLARPKDHKYSQA